MRKSNIYKFVRALLLMQVFMLLLFIGVGIDFNKWSQITHLVNLNGEAVMGSLSGLQISNDFGKLLLQEASVMITANPEEAKVKHDYLGHDLPRDLLLANIQALATTDRDYDISQSEEIEPKSEAIVSESPEIIAADSPLNTNSDYFELFTGKKAALYCTHSGESYIPDSGDARVEKEGLINDVAVSLSESLSLQGLECDFISTVHDFPDFNKSYTNSRETVNKVIAQNPNKLLALFDIHRDSIPGLKNADTITVDGEKAAVILIIVGTNERKKHDHWQENLDFANRLKKQSDKLYPGLIKAVRTKAGTYNQEFHNHALLLEFGSDQNTLEECKYSTQLFADILLEVLKAEK